jgi:hypothetical protein
MGAFSCLDIQIRPGYLTTMRNRCIWDCLRVAPFGNLCRSGFPCYFLCSSNGLITFVLAHSQSRL